MVPLRNQEQRRKLGPEPTPAIPGPHTGPLLEALWDCRVDAPWDPTVRPGGSTPR